MDKADIDTFMLEAIRLAEHGMNKGDGGPFGAVIVKDGEIISRGWNRVLATNDPTAHAEIVAIREACLRTGDYRLERCDIFVNCEPCPMCLAAIYWARINSLTFGASREDAAMIGFEDAKIYTETCLKADQRSISIRQHGRDSAVRVMKQWPKLADKRDY